MKSALRPWLTVALGAACALAVAAPTAAHAEEEASKSSWDLPIQRLGIGVGVGGMGLAGANISLGFDPYSQLQIEVAARGLTGTLEQQTADGFPDYDPTCAGDTDVYPCAANALMGSVGLLLGKHNTWEGHQLGVAVRTGMSTLGEVYTSVGPFMEGQLNEAHTLTWNAELSLGYWFFEPRRAPSDLLALAWAASGGTNESPLYGPSERLLVALRLGVEFYPLR